MDFRYLKAFVLTARYKSFSKAAEELKIAQSAVSRQIKLLEDSLDFELIIRSSKKVILTDKAKELYHIILQFDESTKNLFSQEENRPLKVGVLHGLLESWLTQVITQFYKKHNQNIAITVGTPEELEKILSEGKLDIIFTTHNIQSEIISSLKIFDEKMYLISKKEIDPKKLNQYRWIVYSNKDHLLKLFKNPSPDILQVQSVTSIVKLVKNGVGIAVVPHHVLSDKDGLQTYFLKELPKSEIFMTTLSYQKIPKHFKNFINLVEENIL